MWVFVAHVLCATRVTSAANVLLPVTIPGVQRCGKVVSVGMPLQQATYDSSQVPTFLATLTGAPHQYIESNGGGEERPAIVAWMRYWIYGDMGGSPYFFGDDCVLCGAPWENPQRKNWP